MIAAYASSVYASVEPSFLDPLVHADAPHQVMMRVVDVPEPPAKIVREQQQKQGEAVVREIQRQAPLYDDWWSHEQLMQLLTPLYRQAGLPAPTALLCILDDNINAFATTGGVIGINTGLILAATHPDQVAGVLAHEVAHVSQHHLSRRESDLKYSKWLSIGGVIAGMLIGKQDADAGSALVLGSQAAAIQQSLAYSRDQEREADRIGMALMRAVGYSPHAMADFFEVMQRTQGQRGFLPDFVLTHPLTAERISEAKLRAAQDPMPQLDPEQHTQFELLQGRLAILTRQINVQTLKARVQAGHEPSKILLAMWYGKNRQFTQARQLIDPILKANPDDVLVHITAAEIELADQQPKRAEQIILPVYRAMPEHSALGVLYAQSLMAQGQTAQAMQVLEPLTSRYPTVVSLWQLLQQAASAQPTSPQNTIEVLRYRAEAQWWSGAMDEAVVSLERAQALSKQNQTEQLSKIQTRLEQMRDDRKIKAQ